MGAGGVVGVLGVVGVVGEVGVVVLGKEVRLYPREQRTRFMTSETSCHGFHLRDKDIGRK